jgi:hypothetical protein
MTLMNDQTTNHGDDQARNPCEKQSAIDVREHVKIYGATSQF